ncbi:MAG: hypothetical protein II963_01790 [Bacteroidales bacterium]|nr:hypothetical protein [Bacteroidales bacterium]MBQ6080865.1 hypothetical protein [Bacteroidales bacterium]
MKRVILLFAIVAAISCACNKNVDPEDKSVNIYGNKIIIDATQRGDVLPNIADNVNVWDMGKLYYHPQKNEEADVFEFVRYVQFMQCTGGNTERDLFRRPTDRSVLDDYNFEPLITNCRGVLKMGAKPHLKLGSVPLKLTTNPVTGTFGTNIYPPDDYNQYYTYIKAVIQALVDEFGVEEVRTWRFGCMTEYENFDWFKAKSGLGSDSFEAYCKLYDYTVQALVDVLGPNVFVGAHSMTCTEGGWDEAKFIEHCASGSNYANGGKGTPIKFLASSFYDVCPGTFASGHDLPGSIKVLKDAASKAGLSGVIFGVDEGRILSGLRSGKSSKDLYNRTTGYTWQAAYDARLYKQGIDNGLDYFSTWNFLTGGNISGYPIISYHVARNIAKFEGMYKVKTDVGIEALDDSEVDCLAATDGATVRVMVYNFKNKINYARRFNYGMQIKLPFDAKKVQITRYLVNDDCNFFDDWLADWEELGITTSDFSWSPDDPLLDMTVTLSNSAAIRQYKTKRDKYIECSRLTPVTEEADVVAGVLTLGAEKIEASNVLFLEIKPL